MRISSSLIGVGVISGVLAVANGGTGLSALGAANTVLTSNGSANVYAQISNAHIATSAAIAYSKLSLTGAILNTDLAGSIAYSKLSLTGAILNADLAGSIAYNKLSLTGAIVNADVAASAAIVASKLDLTSPGSIGTTAAGLGTFTTLTGATIAATTKITIAVASGPQFQVGTVPGTAGQICCGKAATDGVNYMTARNNANGANLTILTGDSSDNLIVGGGNVTGTYVRANNTSSNNVTIGNTSEKVGFFNSAGQVKQTLSGVKSGGTALANLITLLAGHGFLTDGTT